jgi:hypothetical protein
MIYLILWTLYIPTAPRVDGIIIIIVRPAYCRSVYINVNDRDPLTRTANLFRGEEKKPFQWDISILFNNNILVIMAVTIVITIINCGFFFAQCPRFDDRKFGDVDAAYIPSIIRCIVLCYYYITVFTTRRDMHSTRIYCTRDFSCFRFKFFLYDIFFFDRPNVSTNDTGKTEWVT